MITREQKNRFIISRWQYAIGEKPLMEDVEYNQFYPQYKMEFPDDEYSTRVWSEDPCPIDLLKAVNREDLIRKVEIVYGSESMASIRTIEELQSKFGNLSSRTRVSMKVDGWNTQVNYYNGVPISANSRGRTGNNKETNAILSAVPKRISLMGKVKFVGESSIPNEKWEIFKAETGNKDQRASMSTVFAQGMTGMSNFAAFNIITEDEEFGDKYAKLKELGFETPKCMYVNNYQQLLKAIDILSKSKDRYHLLTDGLVVENDNTQIAVRLGAWAESDYLTYVTGYEQNHTPYGLSMVLLVKPIQIEGKEVSRVNITNISQIVQNKLRVGNPVAFVVRSSANPVINVSRSEQLFLEHQFSLDKYRQMIDDKLL